MAGAVKCHVPAAIALEDFDATLREKFCRGENVLGMRISPQSDDRCVFQQEKRVSDTAFFTQANKLFLQAKPCCVVNHAELEDGDHRKLVRSNL